ncbi:hypothetical protein OIU77_017412 [Salix suchowensis]|uniref:Uncharacterized protein n=1 Tax=Salix suchowensis TaxID=1278906 RepID=A0ABQ8ZNN3_9ROSI|nr:hypothetical protein OIU77_017412 [Salix suchowensis]
MLRGYGGWNSRDALQIVDQVFPKDVAVQPSLVIAYFGGNGSMKLIPSTFSPHVPLPEFIENMRKIATHLKSLSEKTRVIFLSVPPANDEMIIKNYGFSHHEHLDFLLLSFIHAKLQLYYCYILFMKPVKVPLDQMREPGYILRLL